MRLEGFNARPCANLSTSMTAAQLTGENCKKGSRARTTAVGTLTVFYSVESVTFDCDCRTVANKTLITECYFSLGAVKRRSGFFFFFLRPQLKLSFLETKKEKKATLTRPELSVLIAPGAAFSC